MSILPFEIRRLLATSAKRINKPVVSMFPEFIHGDSAIREKSLFSVSENNGSIPRMFSPRSIRPSGIIES